MKKRFLIFFVLVQGFALAQSDTEELSLKFVQHLTSSSFQDATEMFNDRVKEKIDAIVLEKLWRDLQKQFGAYQSFEPPQPADIKTPTITHTLLVFEKETLRMRLVFVEDKIGGIFFRPDKPDAKYKSPAYAKNEKFNEIPFFLNSDGLSLPAILCKPSGNNNCPLIVFVHGSGPNDKDETIGPNKVFKDLAHGLASQGIASIRYDKRTYVDPGRSMETPGFNPNHETVIDAVNAVRYAQNLPHVDSERIFILGHSLGGYLSPLIASEERGVKGIIVMAGNMRPLDVLIEEQLNYLFLLDGSISDEEAAALTQLNRSLKYLHRDTFDVDSESDSLPMGLTADYWYFLLNYNPMNHLNQLSIPFLVLQGGRDYQVTKADFELWKQALSNTKNATFRFYKSLNHLMMNGRGKPNPDEYMIPSNVNKKVIKDIRKWVEKL